MSQVYEITWRNKWLTANAKTIVEMAQFLEEAAAELRRMDAAGVKLDTSGMDDDYAMLYTCDLETAKEFGFNQLEENA